jgi:hypothetical protein
MHFHRIVVRHGGRNPLLGAPALSQPANLPCAIISLLQLVQVDWGFSMRRAQGTHQNPLPLLHRRTSRGIERSHRRKLDLRPVLLDIDQ